MTPAPTAAQVRATEAVVDWYVRNYFRTAADPGVPAMFFRRARVGAFAVRQAAFARGEPRALFRALVATAMFQRRQDVQILRILRGISSRDVLELTSAQRLLSLADGTPCATLRSTTRLKEECDLTKDRRTGVGVCLRNPRVRCALKRHTVLLKRYGHFGKVPTSIALSIREHGATDLRGLHAQVMRSATGPRQRAVALEAALSRAWRVSQKIASMFLSMVSNPDLGQRAPWASGVDWTYFVVVDSNVDLFLRSIRYKGPLAYDARRSFIEALSRRIDLRAKDRRVHEYNPRVVQQAMYLFMSAANRRAAGADCRGAAACASCAPILKSRCPLRWDRRSRVSARGTPR